MIVASVSAESDGSLRVEIQTDGDPHPDLLDEVTSRCFRLWVQIQASLPDDHSTGDTDAEG